MNAKRRGPSSTSLAPGFFGKVPARGDFISRRVPDGLGVRWEEWLASLTVAAPKAPGESLPDDGLTAPIWHFMLGSSLVPPDGAVGVLVASTDRVGRLFPFTIIGAAGGTCRLNQWTNAAEALILNALEDDFDPDILDAALVSLGLPEAFHAMGRAQGHWPSPTETERPAPP